MPRNGDEGRNNAYTGRRWNLQLAGKRWRRGENNTSHDKTINSRGQKGDGGHNLLSKNLLGYAHWATVGVTVTAAQWAGLRPAACSTCSRPAAAAATSLQSLLDAVVGCGRTVDARSEATVASGNLQMHFLSHFQTTNLCFIGLWKGGLRSFFNKNIIFAKRWTNQNTKS